MICGRTGRMCIAPTTCAERKKCSREYAVVKRTTPVKNFWQDFVMLICQLLMALALVPTILGPDKPALTTSVLTTSCVAVVATCTGSLRLWLATIGNALIALEWFVLALQVMQ